MTASRSASATLSLTSTLPRASSTPSSSVLICSMAWRLAGIGVGRRVGDQLGVATQDGVDDLQPGGPQRPAGLGDVDDAVDDVGHLRLGGAVGQPDVGLDAALGEVAAGQLGVLGRHPQPCGQVRDRR